MINTIYRLSSPKLFEEYFSDENISQNKIIIRPTHLSICQADQRYYQGNRPPDILNQKLPMALIHEAIGEVIYDPKNEFNIGDKVVMIPNTPFERDNIISENYLKTSKFRSSGFDGFMSEYVSMNKDRLVKISKNINLDIASFIELISVSMHSITRFKDNSHERKNIIGVWGDGTLGYITSLLLKRIFPNSEIYIFGVNENRLSLFSFTNEQYKINEIPTDLTIDHAFECVGGDKSQNAINQIIDIINPEGTINLLGVSEYKIPINTRMILEKGLHILGSSRSGRKDFENSVKFLEKNLDAESYLNNLITNKIKINNMQDISKAFELDANTKFGKTILIWDI